MLHADAHFEHSEGVAMLLGGTDEIRVADKLVRLRKVEKGGAGPDAQGAS